MDNTRTVAERHVGRGCKPRNPRRRSALLPPRSPGAEEEQVMYDRRGHRTHFDRRACRVRARSVCVCLYTPSIYIWLWAMYNINIYVYAVWRGDGRRTERGWESLINDIVLIGMDRVCFRDKWEMDSSAHNTRTVRSRPPRSRTHTHSLAREAKQKYGHFFFFFSVFSVRALHSSHTLVFLLYNNARFY